MSITENFQEIMGDEYTKIIIFCISFFIADNILRRFTAFYDKGYPETYLSQIKKKLIIEEFIIDAMAIIPLFLFIYA
jgi:type I site-specific restriction endonuclease